MEPVFPIPIDLPTRGQGSITQSLQRQLRAAMLDGRLLAGTPLPSSRRVAEALNIARNTVIRAYDLLIAEGYLLPRPGAKPVVANLHPLRSKRPISVDRRLAEKVIWQPPDGLHGAPLTLPERSFRTGMPEHRLFPFDVWRRLSVRVLRDWSKRPFAYPSTLGVLPLREAIAQHVAVSRAVACSGNDVVVTHGMQNAVDLLARILVTPGKTRVAIEHPGYPYFRAVMQAAGARILPIPVDAEGLCVDQLPPRVDLIYVTPSHQSPTGVAMPLTRRLQLLDYAKRHNSVILEDDYDGEFRFDGRPLEALRTLDQDGCVFYLGTFTKTLFPSIRTAFVLAPSWAHQALHSAKRTLDPHACDLTQLTLAAFIQQGHMAAHVRRMTHVYRNRQSALLAGLESLRQWLVPWPAQAGLHVAARFTKPSLEKRFAAMMDQYLPGAQLIRDASLATDVTPGVVIGYGAIDQRDIEQSLRRFGQVLS
ncbi:GntR family transcriptional regulator [Ahniella affigens]|uniref:GntR family transcriptional regulator n=1 Tax=Ahniella affigens TaxID=2021234 RepID=A0A2P1PY12_9GAMM|nr:PLP-dependent aminotransferase family protein [Ahniella affigens]AVP99726.1 GntR family transcriptional regulator [Ahniella affigens]